MCVATAKHRKMRERRTNAVEEKQRTGRYYSTLLQTFKRRRNGRRFQLGCESKEAVDQTVSFIDCQDGSPSIIEIVARRIKRK